MISDEIIKLIKEILKGEHIDLDSDNCKFTKMPLTTKIR